MKLKLSTQKHRSRAHRVLFDNDLPFRGRTERRRDTYQRRLKNQRSFVRQWGDDS